MFLLLTLSMSMSCCDSFLDVSPRSQLSDDTFWSTKSDADLALIGIYDLWGGQGNGDDGFPYSFFLYFADSWSDDGFNQFGGWYEEFAKGNISPESDGNSQRYAELYQIIRRCNVFLKNIERVSIDEKIKKSMIAEARFVRAYEYFLLYYHWGEAQIMDAPISPAQKVGRGKEGETVAFILEDLEFAIINLPLNQKEEGRFDRGDAMGLKARVLLYEASPLSNKNNNILKWKNAANAALGVINLNKYQLFRTKSGNGYSELFDTENENNQEVIIDREHDAVPNHGNQMVRLLSSKAGTIFMVPTQNLVDSYDAYNKNTDTQIPPDKTNPFLSRDPRMKYTLENEPKSVTKYGIIKFETDEFNPSNPNNSGLDSPVNHILMRYAEILLSYAEAKIEANEIDQSVVDAINQVRSRAYGVGIADISKYPEITKDSQDNLRKIVRKERRVELAMEGLRWYDIRRWKTAEKVRNQPVRGRSNPKIVIRSFDSGRDYFWPIPQREIDLMGRNILLQNPSY